MATSVARQIRKARKEMHLSQDRFAEALGVSRRSPARWESGSTRPHPRHLERIAEVTGRPVAWFFSEYDDDDNLDELHKRTADVVDAIATARRMTEDLLREIERVRETEREVA